MKNNQIIFKVLFFCSIYTLLLVGDTKSQVIEPLKKDSIFLNIFYQEAKTYDTLFLTLHGTLVNRLGISTDRVYKVVNQNGHFIFNFPVDANYGYWTLRKARTFSKIGNESSLMPMMRAQFWEKGDSVSIDLSFCETQISIYPKANYKVYGKGAAKYNASNNLENFQPKNLIQGVKVNGKTVDFNGKEFLQEGFDVISDWDLAKLAYLKKYEGKITPLSFDVLKASLSFSGLRASMFKITSAFYMDSIQNSVALIKKRFLSKSKLLFDTVDQYGISDEALANSIDYLNYLFCKYQAESYLQLNRQSLSWIYNEVKKKTTGNLRDNLLMKCFLEIRSDTDLTNLYQEAKKIMQSPSCIRILEEMQSRSPGKSLANYQFKDMKGNTISLLDLRNKVVLIDIWFTGCGACTVYFNNVLSKVEQKFTGNLNVVFLSICLDQQKERWLKSVESGKYTSKEAINVYTNGFGNQHPFLKNNNIQVAPTAILLDKYGKISLFNANLLYNEKTLTKAIMKLL